MKNQVYRIFFYLAKCSHMSYSVSTSILNQICEYKFMENECLGLTYFDSSRCSHNFGALRQAGFQSKPQCLRSNGISFPARSLNSTQSWAQSIDPTSFSIEMWLQLNTNKSWPILSFVPLNPMDCSPLSIIYNFPDSIVVSTCNSEKSVQSLSLILPPPNKVID